jgi:hypothetical protein
LVSTFRPRPPGAPHLVSEMWAFAHARHSIYYRSLTRSRLIVTDRLQRASWPIQLNGSFA